MNNKIVFFRLFSLWILVLLTSISLPGQVVDNNKAAAEIGLILFGGHTSALEFERDYSAAQASQADVVSDSSYQFGLRASYSQAFHPRFSWKMGLEGGVDAYQLGVVASGPFLNSLVNRPYEQAIFVNLAYAAVLMGLKYQLPISKRSELTLSVGGRFTFFMPVSTSVGFGRFISNGTGAGTDVLYANMRGNPDNELIVSPEFGLDYAYHFPRSNFVLLAGFNTSFSRKTILRGNYLIFGEQEVLTGTLSKEMQFFRLGLGVAYRFH